MKQYLVYILFAAIALSSCNQADKKARAQLEKATELYNQNDFVAAKTEIDSLRALYPKSFDALKEGLTLMRQIELKESERDIAYIDSLLPIRQQEAEVLVKGFVFEKDSAYEEIGNYIWKQQVIERNLERSYLRSGVNEKGEIYLASVYSGSGAINHTGLRVSVDSLSAETATIPYDGGVNYRFENLGKKTEVVTYKAENGIDVIKFIADNQTARIKATYTGGKLYVIYIADADKKAIAATYNLALVLNEVRQMSLAKNKALKRIDYLRGKAVK